MQKRGALFFAALAASVAFGASTTRAQEKNEVGLVIGATLTPNRELATGTTARVSFDRSLALGAEYDRHLVGGSKAAVYAGVDFLASPLDLKLSNPPNDVIGQYAYIFLTPHVRVKFRPGRALSPWLSFGGGYTRFLEKKPAAAPGFVPGTNTGTFVFGGGVNTRTVVRVLRIPSGFEPRFAISTQGRRTTIKAFAAACRTTWPYGRSADQVLKRLPVAESPSMDKGFLDDYP